MNVGPYMAYVLYIYIYIFIIYTNKMAYTAHAHAPPTEFSVPKRNKKVGGVKKIKKMSIC